MAVHGILVQRYQQVDPISRVGDLLRPGTNGQECMTAAYDRLIGVVRVQMQSPAAEDFGEDITRRCDPLPRRTSNADRKGLVHTSLPIGDRLPRCSLPVPGWFAPDRR